MSTLAIYEVITNIESPALPAVAPFQVGDPVIDGHAVNKGWLLINGQQASYATRSANKVLVATDVHVNYLDASSNNVDVELPASATVDGEIFRFKLYDVTGAFVGKVSTNGVEEIDGETDDYIFDSKLDWLTVQAKDEHYAILS